MVFKVVVSDKNESYQIEVDSNNKKIIGLSIGEDIDGALLGLDGYTLTITGGSDKNGFPMKKDVSGSRRIKSLLSGGIGYNPKAKGIKRRKTIRGTSISDEIVQINTVVSKSGKKSINAILNPEPEEEAKPEE
ncbi:30S ribosomal protein S6e [Methanobrevibacter cuticularis]|uniref:Small ribosomal subunit protein eS6 n=1 Tax=Methanobrevibacter cuticularis TaxID=47311 RepID=A0A166EYY0_9EURY|nr:30S ribosomal protein S6e [Methanobrevibacter cuticularis]KZX17154.1 30S ribosomal protein S6e [Methanobrevibacter cuticularis]